MADPREAQLLARIEALEKENTLLRQKIDALARRIFGTSSEKLDPAQLLFLLQGIDGDAGPGKAAGPVAAEVPQRSKVPSSPRERRLRVPEHLPVVEEVIAHIAWLDRQPPFDLCLLLHEDWESHGFYLYEQNPDGNSSLAEAIIESVTKICPVDLSTSIEGRPAEGGIVRAGIDPRSLPDWPEAFYVIMHKTRVSYTLEAPSDFELTTRVEALVVAVNTALETLAS